MAVLTGDRVDDGLRVGHAAPHGLIGQAQLAEILEYQNEVVGVLVEGSEVGVCRPQRVGHADLFVKPHLAEVELEVLAECGPGSGVESGRLR